MQLIQINENGIYLVFGITEEKQLKLLHFSHVPFDESTVCGRKNEYPDNYFDEARRNEFIKEAFQLVQVNFSGYDRPYEKHGNKHIVTAPGYLFTYVGMEDTRNEIGRKLVITQEDTEVTQSKVETTMQFYDGTSIVRMWSTVYNLGTEMQTLEYISSFAYTGIEKEGKQTSDEKMRIRVPFHGWQKELSVQEFNFEQLGLAHTQPICYQRTSCVYEVTNTGHWSAKKYLPLGYIENQEAHSSLFWQIEHNGSWHYEIGDQNQHFYLCVSGPTELQSHWFKNLQPGESFTSVPVAVGVAEDSFETAIGELTKYRRMIRRPNKDNDELPVIFNDYMNCLFADPTTEKEIPLIDAAAEAGCDYFVIDAGWYAPGFWWDSVGEWKESCERFPNGVREVTDYIRSKGMIAGVWLELEVMGIKCDKAKSVPDDWFFVRHGKRVFDRSRYQLDFRNPAVLEHVNEVIDRVVRDYGVGYIKMDYNIEPGIGTELGVESVGQGLLEHEKAYLNWLDDVFRRYPDLVIENCSSGGLRMDYALLSRHSIQSTSDQEDYRNYATISANAAIGVTPEQAAVWSYPMKGKDEEEAVFNMVNVLLLRIHQSGHLAQLDPARKALVEEGIQLYREIRGDIKDGVPFWPVDTASNRDIWLASGLQTDKKAYLAVWKRKMDSKLDNRADQSEENVFQIPLQGLGCVRKGLAKELKVKQIYPVGMPVPYELDGMNLKVKLEKDIMARLFEIEW